jgi:sRNA-binding protein
MACSTPGAIRLDLVGNAAGKITESEALNYEQDAKESFARIETGRRIRSGSAVTPTPAASPRPTTMMVNSALSTPEMLALIEKQVASLKAILIGDAIDESLRGVLARPVLQLIKDELQTIDARVG